MVLSLQSVYTLLYIVTFAVFASAEQLAFTAPDFKNNTNVTYGEDITVKWTSPFENTTVVVYQELANSTTLFEILAAKAPKDKTSAQWKAGGIGGHAFHNSTFHFYIQESSNSTCANCNATSVDFTVALKAAQTTSASTSTPTARFGTTSLASHSSSATATAGAGSALRKPGDTSSLTIELGAGLGAGVPAALALFGIFGMWIRHRYKRKHRLNNQGTDASPDESTPSTLSKDAQMRQKDHRESGALGPWAGYSSSQGDPEAAAAAARRERRHRSSQKYDYTPFRPSMFTHSETPAESVAEDSQVRIDNFDFEQPEYRDSSADEMSQVHRSIREAQSRPGSQYSAHSTRSHLSLGDNNEPLVPEMPEMPPPAHSYSTMGDTWPMR